MNRAGGMSAIRVLPPLAWTALIGWFSTEGWSGAETASVLLPLLRWLAPSAGPEQLEALHWLVRKTAHAAEYGTLAALWRWALGSREAWRGWLAPLGLSILTAALDELHQSTTLTRTASLVDVLLDSAGAAAALIALSGGTRLVCLAHGRAALGRGRGRHRPRRARLACRSPCGLALVERPPGLDRARPLAPPAPDVIGSLPPWQQGALPPPPAF